MTGKREPRGILLVGIDGGASRTRVLVTDERGEETAALEGPPSALEPGGPEGRTSLLEELVRGAAERAGLGDLLPARALVAGLAGAGRAESRLAAERALTATGVAGRVRVVTDVEAAFRDAFPAGPGILLMAGTGSILLARWAPGALLRIGGWGPVLGDEGSGYRVALAGLRAVLEAHDGRGPETLLERELLLATGVAAPPELPRWVAGAGREAVAALAPTVLETAEGGDPVASGIRDGAVDALRGHLEVARRRLRAVRSNERGEPPRTDLPRVALAGGLLDPGAPLRAAVEAAVRSLGLDLRAGRVRPERGAARMALELVDEEGAG